MSSAKTKNTRWYIDVAIMFAIYFVFKFFIPPFAGITEMGVDILGITFALLWGWIRVDLMWTSLLGFVMIHFSGYMTLLPAISAGIGNTTLMMVFVLLAFAVALGEIGASDVIARWVITRKIFVGRPTVFVFGLLFGTILLSAAGGGMACIFIIWDLIRRMCKANGMADDDTLKGSLMAMVLYCGMIGFILPWQNTMYMFGGFWMKGAGGLQIPIMETFYCGIVWAILSVVMCVLAFKYIFRMDFSKLVITEELTAEYGQKKATTQQKAALILLAVYVGLLLFANVFKTNPLSVVINALGATGLSIIYMAIFAIWKKDDGKPTLDVINCFRATPWPVILLIAVTIPLGDALQSGDTGVMAAIAGWLMPLVQGMSPTMFIAVCTIILTVLTQVLHNVICGAVFFPMLTPIVVQLGGNPYVFFVTVFIGLMSAYATPAASMFSGLVFGTPDISTKAGYLAGWTYTAATIIILVTLMPLWNIIMPAV